MRYQIITGKASWFSAFKKCESIGPDWVLPAFDSDYDRDLINQGLEDRKWSSIWTGVKKEIFDAFYWEDGNLEGK